MAGTFFYQRKNYPNYGNPRSLFLERVCNEILELDEGVLYNYKGNYSYFLDKRQARIEIFASETAKAKQLFKKELDWMRRQPKARTTKSKSRIDDFHEIKSRAHQRRNDHEDAIGSKYGTHGNKGCGVTRNFKIF